MKHTPAPWYAVLYADHYRIQDGPRYDGADILQEKRIGDDIYDTNDYIGSAEANAKLAAAAPDLLAACKAISWEVAEMAKALLNTRSSHDIGLGEAWMLLVEQCNDAIGKAEGVKK